MKFSVLVFAVCTLTSSVLATLDEDFDLHSDLGSVSDLDSNPDLDSISDEEVEKPEGYHTLVEGDQVILGNEGVSFVVDNFNLEALQYFFDTCGNLHNTNNTLVHWESGPEDNEAEDEPFDLLSKVGEEKLREMFGDEYDDFMAGNAV